MTRETLTSMDGFAFEVERIQASGARKGGLILIQEIFGLNSFVMTMGNRFAAEGYEVVMPSMFDRQEKGFTREGHDEEAIATGVAHAQANGRDAAMADIGTCIAALEGPVFITGFCYGGSMAYLAACELDGLAAASCYYGGLLPTLKSLSPNCPTIAHFGYTDPHIPVEGAEAFMTARKEVPTYFYDAGHGFAREGDDYAPEADVLAMQRTLDLFEAALIR